MYTDGFPKTLYEQIELIWDTLIDGTYSIKDSNNNIILYDSDVLLYLQQRYGCYKTQADFTNLWRLYNAIHLADFQKAWAAWTADYNPLENYNGIETNVRQYMDGDETETITHGKTTTNSTGAGGIVTVTQVTTFDSTTPRDDTKTTNTGTTTATDSGTTTTGKVKSAKNLTVDETTYTADKIEAETNSRHGNLGVTTSQQMITSETEMRMNPITMLYLDTFVSEYCYYVSSMWGCCE